jgi:phosphoesterase RecJ-like protein
MTDTGSFRFPKTSTETHHITASLLEKGIDPTLLYQEVYDRNSVNRIQLLGQVLACVLTAHTGKVAYTVITHEMFRSTDTNLDDADNFINYTLSIDGVVVGLLFAEQDHGVKISFRSKGNISINELAKEFGGNGHKNAAGARTEGIPLETIVRQVLEKVANYI